MVRKVAFKISDNSIQASSSYAGPSVLTQFMSDDCDKCNGKIKNLWQGSQCQSESPSSSLKGSSHPGPRTEGFGKIIEGWHCSSQERRLPGGSEAPRSFLPCHDIPPTNSSHCISVLPPLFHVPK